MKGYKLVLLGIFISTRLIHAQTDFRAGYIVRFNGDTLYGKIDYRGDLSMSMVCKFQSTDSRVTEYSPYDIAAFRFIDSKFYVAREVYGKHVFLEYLIKGQVNIYYLRDLKGDHYFIDKEGEKLAEMPYEEKFKQVDDKEFYYESTRHIGFLNYYMQDAPELKTRIQHLNKPTHQNLIRLAEDYHHAVCANGPCIVYEKQLPFLKVNLQVVSGIISFTEGSTLSGKTYMQNGVLAHFWMPRANEKVYFETGMLYTPVQQESEFYGRTYFRIPVHIGYMAPGTYRIRPSFSVGLIFPSYSAGVHVKLSKRINLGVQGWTNFSYNDYLFLMPERLLNYSVLGSVYIEL